MAYAAGDVIEKRYRILGKVGSGAHGDVYRARDLETRGEVALKFLSAGIGLDPEYARRMEREALAMARLRGTNAVYVHGFRLNHDGSIYIVMEMLHGKNLEQFLKAAEKVGGRMKVARMLELLRPVVDTLEAAHAQGIVHRDLKPGNIFVVDRDHGGGVRLLDFGLVKILGAESLTQGGTIAGTPSYIAPEAWKGDPRTLDQRIDVYAMGVIVFRALAGHVPYKARSLPLLMMWAQKGERPSLHALRPKLPEEIDGWVQRVLAIEPKDRYQTVRAMWNALEGIVAQKAAAPY
ncbi:MAG TPA: serine/threonine-protein kinase [Polyangiaceae bacterium]|nr:serine/threonine-protein kinase [Polyangiaceae bacterium]